MRVSIFCYKDSADIWSKYKERKTKQTTVKKKTTHPGLEFDPLDLLHVTNVYTNHVRRRKKKLVILLRISFYQFRVCAEVQQRWDENWIRFKFSCSPRLVRRGNIYFSRLTSSPLPRSGRPSFLFLEWKQLDWVPSVDWPSRETRPCCARKLDRMNLLHPLSMYVLALLKTIKLKRLHFQCDTLSRACC